MAYGTDCPFRDLECNKVWSLFIANLDGFEGCSLKLMALNLSRLVDSYGLCGK
jgi:hypothetical protein